MGLKPVEHQESVALSTSRLLRWASAVRSALERLRRERQRQCAHGPSTAARDRSAPPRTRIEEGIANRLSKIRDPLW